MMIIVQFNAQMARIYLDCFMNGRPIEQRNRGHWSDEEFFTLLGVLSAIISHPANLGLKKYESANEEQREAMSEKALRLWAHATKHCVEVTRMIEAGTYHLQYEIRHTVRILMRGEEILETVLEGMKEPPQENKA